MKKTIKALLLMVIFDAYAESAPPNYCHDKKVNQDWKNNIAEYSNDPIITKLAALREGLCNMIDRGEITIDQGVDIWEDERQRSVFDRQKETARQTPKYTL